ncbi:hypothetical protein ACFXHA_12865 [Nocardia sp. NPDC059240]
MVETSVAAPCAGAYSEEAALAESELLLVAHRRGAAFLLSWPWS